jgi:hypothetical protein
VLKVLLSLECDNCCQTMTHIRAVANANGRDYEALASELPLIAQRCFDWRASDNVHICPQCVAAFGDLTLSDSIEDEAF